jgi:hypothetical protein
VRSRPIPADCVSSYGYRHKLPGLSAEERLRGLYWRWNVADVTVFDGAEGGIMACYLARLPFWQRVRRRIEGYLSLIGWMMTSPEPEPVKPPLPAPVVEPEFRYPPGLDMSAFWFRLDFSGPSNPRDPGFEWAWNKPLLPVEAVEYRDRARPQPQDVEQQLDRLTAIDQTGREPDASWREFMESEFTDHDEFLLWKAGKVKGFRDRLREFDDRYERPVCSACGRSHPELNTPMKKDGSAWAYRDSYYFCNGCGRKWQNKALKAALANQPIPEKVKLRQISEILPEALRRPPRPVR